jgi:hypothetical protein
MDCHMAALVSRRSDRHKGASRVFVHGGSVAKVATLTLEALGLELVKGFLELAGEALAVESERGEQAVGVDDVESGGLGLGAGD